MEDPFLDLLYGLRASSPRVFFMYYFYTCIKDGVLSLDDGLIIFLFFMMMKCGSRARIGV